METAGQQLINALMLGSGYALIALGFTLVFGVLHMLNMAHGDVFMLGAFMALVAVKWLHLPLFLALLTAVAGTAVLGMLIERVCFRPISPKFRFGGALSSMALEVVIAVTVVNLMGSEASVFPTEVGLPDLAVGPLLVSSGQLASLVMALVLMVGLSSLLTRTKLGRAMRALGEKPQAAKLVGVNTGWVSALTFMIASALAGVAGILMGVRLGMVSPFLGVTVGLKGLAIMCIGGIGNIWGAVLASYLLGVVEVFNVGYGPSGYTDVIIWGALILILLVRPGGLLGSRI